MKSTILIITLLSCSLSAFGQNKIDEKGRKQGPWQKTLPKSKVLQYKGQFKDDKPVGTFTYYYPSNSIQAVIKHDPNSTRSVAIFYFENGVVLSKGIYQNMKKDSIWLNYGPSGRLSLSESYKNDLLDGPRIIYYLPEDLSNKVKNIQSITYFSKGMLNGEKTEYFDNGAIRSKANYVSNKKEGVCISNHPSGNLMILERYKNGQLHGWASAQDDSGKETGRHYYYYGEKLEGKKLEFKMKQFKEKGINPNN